MGITVYPATSATSASSQSRKRIEYKVGGPAPHIPAVTASGQYSDVCTGAEVIDVLVANVAYRMFPGSLGVAQASRAPGNTIVPTAFWPAYAQVQATSPVGTMTPTGSFSAITQGFIGGGVYSALRWGHNPKNAAGGATTSNTASTQTTTSQFVAAHGFDARSRYYEELPHTPNLPWSVTASVVFRPMAGAYTNSGSMSQNNTFTISAPCTTIGGITSGFGWQVNTYNGVSNRRRFNFASIYGNIGAEMTVTGTPVHEPDATLETSAAVSITWDGSRYLTFVLAGNISSGTMVLDTAYTAAATIGTPSHIGMGAYWGGNFPVPASFVNAPLGTTDAAAGAVASAVYIKDVVIVTQLSDLP